MKKDTIDNISYTLRKSVRAKRMRISVLCEGKVLITIPSRFLGFETPNMMVETFIREKLGWIKSTLDKFSVLPEWQKKKYTRKDYLNNKETARVLVQKRLEYFNQFYKLNWNRISIRDQKSRWGSCSRRSNLNFNYKILFLPEELRDYVIIHELCHLKELNHSEKFWTLVGKILPEYKALRKKLKGGVQ